MSQAKFQNIARRLAAAGYTPDASRAGVHLLYVDGDDGSLISKHWTGSLLGRQELITEGVRPNSSAAYLIAPSSEHTVCVTSSSTLCVLEYDSNEETWTTLKTPQYKIHPNGKFAACPGNAGQLPLVFFQDPSERLLCLSGTWDKSIILPLSPVAGSPIFTNVFNDNSHIFFVSARDQYIHYVVIGPDGKFTERIMAKCKFREGLKQFLIEQNSESGAFEAYVLTEKRVLLQVTADGKDTVFGEVDSDGDFIPGRSVDQCCNDAWAGTLTLSRLETYLQKDRSVLNSIGGERHVTPLAAACWGGHLDAVQLLLSKGANPAGLSPDNRTPLFYVTSFSPPLDRHKIVCALLDAGAAIDECYAENNLNTPLMNAIAIAPDEDVVRELLKRGASRSTKNAQGQTAVMLAKGTALEAILSQGRPKTPVPSRRSSEDKRVPAVKPQIEARRTKETRKPQTQAKPPPEPKPQTSPRPKPQPPKLQTQSRPPSEPKPQPPSKSELRPQISQTPSESKPRPSKSEPRSQTPPEPKPQPPMPKPQPRKSEPQSQTPPEPKPQTPMPGRQPPKAQKIKRSQSGPMQARPEADKITPGRIAAWVTVPIVVAAVWIKSMF